MFQWLEPVPWGILRAKVAHSPTLPYLFRIDCSTFTSRLLSLQISLKHDPKLPNYVTMLELVHHRLCHSTLVTPIGKVLPFWLNLLIFRITWKLPATKRELLTFQTLFWEQALLTLPTASYNSTSAKHSFVHVQSSTASFRGHFKCSSKEKYYVMMTT